VDGADVINGGKETIYRGAIKVKEEIGGGKN
jgi:hypothetical protein